MSNTKYIIVSLLIGLVVGAGIYSLIDKNSSTAEISKIREFGKDSTNDERVFYTNSQYGFSFYYPKGLIYKEFDEGVGSQTIVFQSPSDTKISFQIYITPYTESTITGERILFDIPSGNVSNLEETQLTEDLLVATFISNDPFVGETKEIWFIDGKYLYQATTFKNLDQWLTEIISTWEFSSP